MEVFTKSSQETKRLGHKIGSSLKGGEVLLLSGDLGSGKTTFVQGLAKGLGIKNRITSPTFMLMRQYENFFHLDLYRLETNIEEELKNLGVEEIWGELENVVVIEWAEKAKDIYPKNAKWIHFVSLDENTRKIELFKTNFDST